MLVVPPFYKSKINQYSYFLEPPLNSLSLQTLFTRKENADYLNAQIRFLLKNKSFVQECDSETPCREPQTRDLLIENVSSDRIKTFVDTALQRRHFEFPSVHNNPIIDLHEINKSVIQEIAKQIITDPGLINSVYDRTFLGKVEMVDYGYSEYSFRGGTWHPEDLFTESANNRKNPYFKNFEVWIDPNAVQPGNRVRYDNGGKSPIPYWQNPNKRRNYADVNDGFGTNSGSREQTPHNSFAHDNTLTQRKYNGDYYLTYPVSAQMDCKKIKYQFN